MKFKVREGFVVKLQNVIDLGDNRKEVQETTHFAGQSIDVDVDVADLHAHKLEPLDKAATAYLDAQVLPVSQASQLGITPETMAFATAMAKEIAAQMVAALKPVPATA